MGDRGNIVVDGVYLYSHWGGSELPKVLQEALAKQWRWTDGAYLCRIIFDCMTRGHHDTETGFGISLGLCDNEHPILHVSSNSQTVKLKTEKGKDLGAWTFREYIELAIDPDMDDQFAALGAKVEH